MPDPPATAEGRRTRFQKADGPAAVDALRRLELPFFATSSVWKYRPTRGLLLRGSVRSSLRARFLENEAEARAILEAELGRALGLTVQTHWLRDEEQEDGGEPRYSLFVTDASAARDEGSLILSVVSLVVSMACASRVGSTNLQRMVGLGASLLAPGASLPVGLLCGLLAAGVAAQAAAAQGLGGSWTPPLFLPSPQLGLVGSFSTGKEAPYPSRSAALLAALSGPITIAVCSVALVAYGTCIGTDADITLLAPLGVAWPLAWLPPHCDPAVWAGVSGLLVASLALLPHSPNGQAALQSLVGVSAAKQASDIACYVYPLLGLVCSTSYGPGWFAFPMWWTLLAVNFGPSVTPPLEEISEVHPALRLTAGIALAAACIAMVPLPLQLLLS